METYLAYLYQRPSRTKQGGLSKNYIRKQVQVIKKFSRYLSESGQQSFTVKLRIKGKSSNIKSILTQKEVERLYEATPEDRLGLRDKAMLALYYGCGLRKNEALAMNVNDLRLEKELVYVRKGKGHKERYVPLSGQNKADLESYLNYGRPYLASTRKEEALLLNIRGRRLKTAFERIQKLRKEARITIPHDLLSGEELEELYNSYQVKDSRTQRNKVSVRPPHLDSGIRIF